MLLTFATGALAGERPTSPDLRPALKEVYKDYFLMGNTNATAGSFSGTPGEYGSAAMNLKHFNVVTPGNAFKPESTWSSITATFGSGMSGQVANVRAVNAAGFKFNAHTLLWHNQSANWPPNAATGFGNRTAWNFPTARTNLETFIKNVAGYNMDPSRADAKIYAWDVINEPMKDNPENPADWRNSLRTGFNPEERPGKWADSYSQGGYSWDYVYDAFSFARKYTDAILNYNDFNDAENLGKVIAIASMAKEFNDRYAIEHPEDPRKLVEVIGTQGHYDMRLNLDALERALKIYLELGVNVDLTEFEFMVNIALDKGQRIAAGAEMNEIFDQQGILYAKFFTLIKEYAAGSGGRHPEYKGGVHRVTWWGMTDPGYHVNGYPWSSAGSATTASSPKEAYWATVDPEGYLEDLDLTPGGPATFSFGGKDYSIRTWGDPHFAELDIYVPTEIKNVEFTAANVTLPSGFRLVSIKLDPADGAVRAGEPCHVTVKSVSATNPKNTATYKLSLGRMAVSWFKDTSALESPNLAYAEVRFSDGVTEFAAYKPHYVANKETNDGKLKTSAAENKVVPKGERATLILNKDNPIPNGEKAWRLAKRIETGRTYMIVSTEAASADQGFALTNRTKPATAGAAPESLSRSRVAINGEILSPLPHESGHDNPNGLGQDNLKFVFQEMKSPAPGPYANQTGYMIECFIHGTNVYPQAVFRGNGATGTLVNGNYSLITRQTNGSEGPQIADRVLDRAVWFNTGIDPVTGETRMFMYSEDTSKHYVLKELEIGATPSRDTGNAISQRQSSTGGFVAMEADSPSAGTKVKLYVYDIEPYDDEDDPGTGDHDCKSFKEWWDEHGCNIGLPILALIALAGLLFRRK